MPGAPWPRAGVSRRTAARNAAGEASRRRRGRGRGRGAQVEGCWIVKSGSDAARAAIIDVTWPSPATPGGRPVVEARLVTCADYPENPVRPARAVVRARERV